MENNAFIKVPVKTYYLKFNKLKKRFPEESDSEISLNLFSRIDLDVYRKLYSRVGEEWGWASRKILSDEELEKIIHDENLLIYGIYFLDELVGFAEVDNKTKGESEIVYFGLLPEKVGKGIGSKSFRILLELLTNESKIWLHTCEFDHESALTFYLKHGFEIEKEQIDYEYYEKKFVEVKKLKY